MKHLLRLTLLLAACLVVSCSDDDEAGSGSVELNVNRNDTSTEPALARLEFPKVKEAAASSSSIPPVTSLASTTA